MEFSAVWAYPPYLLHRVAKRHVAFHVHYDLAQHKHGQQSLWELVG